jgi:hypothetical protein
VLFETPRGYIEGGDGGNTYDARVVDADGTPLLVWAGWTPLAPDRAVTALREMVDSVALRHWGRP